MRSRKILTACVLSLLVVTGRAAAEVDFVKDIKPILEQSCLKCHGAEKPKSGLRIDTREGLIKGSRGGPVIEVGKADKSLFYTLTTKPKDDPERMPPEGDGLTKEQAEKLKTWINEGVKWPTGLVLKDTTAPSTATTKKDPLDGPGLPISDAEKTAVAKLQGTGVLAMRLAQNTAWLRADFSLSARELKDADLAALKDIPNLVELDLGGTTVTDAGLAHLAGLKNLVRLQLEKTKVTDAGLAHLKGLDNLVSLNVYGTEVTDKGLEHLQGLKNLKRVYVWQTKVTEAGAKKLSAAIPGLQVERGLDAAPVEPPKPAGEEKKAPPKK